LEKGFVPEKAVEGKIAWHYSLAIFVDNVLTTSLQPLNNLLTI